MKIKKAEAVCFTVNFIAAKLFISAPGAFINIGQKRGVDRGFVKCRGGIFFVSFYLLAL